MPGTQKDPGRYAVWTSKYGSLTFNQYGREMPLGGINALTQLPEGTRVGYVCANQRSTETLYNSTYFSGGKELRRILAGYDNTTKLQRLVRECDVIFVTNFVYDRMEKLAKPHQKLINVNITVDSSSMDLIRERLYQ